MIDFRIDQLMPAFLLQDKNGYATAKAMEAGIRYFLDRCQTGLDIVQNVDKMPEWRLDELAEELNCLYDYHAGIAAKRHWIKEAKKLDQKLGTIDAIKRYLEGSFSNVIVEEWWEYGAAPYHFRVSCSGDMTSAAEIWARRAISRAQNVRSILDGLAIYKENGIVFSAQKPIAVAMPVLMCGDHLLCGEE